MAYEIVNKNNLHFFGKIDIDADVSHSVVIRELADGADNNLNVCRTCGCRLGFYMLFSIP